MLSEAMRKRPRANRSPGSKKLQLTFSVDPTDISLFNAAWVVTSCDDAAAMLFLRLCEAAGWRTIGHDGEFLPVMVNDENKMAVPSKGPVFVLLDVGTMEPAPNSPSSAVAQAVSDSAALRPTMKGAVSAACHRFGPFSA
jgi:hypothetical protein